MLLWANDNHSHHFHSFSLAWVSKYILLPESQQQVEQQYKLLFLENS
jgi:hypothetical protein